MYMLRQIWANSVDPDQTAPVGAVWSESALFAINPTVLSPDSFGPIQIQRLKKFVMVMMTDEWVHLHVFCGHIVCDFLSALWKKKPF